ncbi:MAG: serine/threonine-protein kinase [bacterium]
MNVIDRERWQRLEPLLDRALDLPLAERASWIDSLRTSDPDLAAELDALLSDDAVANDRGFLSRPIEVTLAGLEIGAYTLERPLGHGGMGSVWLARRTDGRFEGRAAVKLLNLSLVSPSGQQRFRREGSLLARLAHPGIARLLDAGVSASGQPYLVLEYVDGERIDAFAKNRGLSVEERVRLLLKVLDAVGHAHANLIVHRDLKPSNILVTADGSVKLLDFGIATLLDAESGDASAALTGGGRAFTPEYAAPEQVRGEAITTATDVYAAGVLLYVLVSGRHPTADGCRTDADAIRALFDVHPARYGTGDLGVVLDKALRKEPADRYATITSFGDDLRRWLNHEPVSARPQSLSYRARKFVRRNRTAVAAVVGGALLGAVYTTTVIVDRERVRRALAEATTSANKAEQVTDFTVGLFEEGGNGRVLKDTVSARELLTNGVTRAHELASQPLIEAQMLDLIGRIRTQLGDYDQARIVLNEALAIRRRELGDIHPDVATSAVSLANLITNANPQDSTAVSMLRGAVATRTKFFGEHDPRTTDAVYQLATTMHMYGDYGSARPIFDQWLTAIQNQPPQLTPTRASQLSQMTYVLEYTHQFKRAEQVSRQAVALYRTLYGERDSRYAEELVHLGGLMSDLNREAEADSILRKAVALMRLAHPDGHTELANALRNLGYHLINVKKWDEAESTWHEAVELYGRLVGTKSLGYANAVVYEGFSQMSGGDYRRGEQTMRRALQLEGIRRPKPNPVGVRLSAYLGEALRAQGRLSEAEPLLLVAIKQPTLAEGTREYAARSLAKLYEAQGQREKAEVYRIAGIKKPLVP